MRPKLPLTTVAKNDCGTLSEARFWRHEVVDVEYLSCDFDHDIP